MRIGILDNSSWGIYNFRLGLVKELQKNNHEVIAIAPNDEYVTYLQNEGVNCFSVDIEVNGINPLKDFLLIKSYYRIFKENKVDVILSYTIKPNIYGNYAAKFLGVNIINNVSGLGTLFIKKSKSTAIALFLYKVAFTGRNWVFFQNETDRNYLTSKSIVNKKKTSVIPGSGVNLSLFNNKRTQNKGNTILFVGRLIGDKGIREFIQAAKILLISRDDLNFLIVGQFGYKNRTAINEKEYKSWSKIPQFTFLGKINEILEVYRQADIMVLPSYREGLSRSLLEACAMELPIVTTNVPGCREVVDKGVNGYLCEPRDATDLASKIKKIIDLPEKERLEMGKASRRNAEIKFDDRLVFEAYIDKIKDFSAKKSSDQFI